MIFTGFLSKIWDKQITQSIFYKIEHIVTNTNWTKQIAKTKFDNANSKILNLEITVYKANFTEQIAENQLPKANCNEQIVPNKLH